MNLEDAEKVLGHEFRRHSKFINQIIKSLNLEKDAKILDVGTGRGVMAINIALNGYPVITGEPEDHKWANWRKKVKKVKLNELIEFRPFRAENLPFENNFLDAIFLYNSLHHISDKRSTLTECNRVLKKKGFLTIIELNKKGVEDVRKRYPSHCDAVDPREYSENLPFSIRRIEGSTINAYIFKKFG